MGSYEASWGRENTTENLGKVGCLTISAASPRQNTPCTYRLVAWRDASSLPKPGARTETLLGVGSPGLVFAVQRLLASQCLAKASSKTRCRPLSRHQRPRFCLPHAIELLGELTWQGGDDE